MSDAYHCRRLVLGSRSDNHECSRPAKFKLTTAAGVVLYLCGIHARAQMRGKHPGDQWERYNYAESNQPTSEHAT